MCLHFTIWYSGQQISILVIEPKFNWKIISRHNAFKYFEVQGWFHKITDSEGPGSSSFRRMWITHFPFFFGCITRNKGSYKKCFSNQLSFICTCCKHKIYSVGFWWGISVNLSNLVLFSSFYSIQAWKFLCLLKISWDPTWDPFV